MIGVPFYSNCWEIPQNQQNTQLSKYDKYVLNNIYLGKIYKHNVSMHEKEHLKFTNTVPVWTNKSEEAKESLEL